MAKSGNMFTFSSLKVGMASPVGLTHSRFQMASQYKISERFRLGVSGGTMGWNLWFTVPYSSGAMFKSGLDDKSNHANQEFRNKELKNSTINWLARLGWLPHIPDSQEFPQGVFLLAYIPKRVFSPRLGQLLLSAMAKSWQCRPLIHVKNWESHLCLPSNLNLRTVHPIGPDPQLRKKKLWSHKFAWSTQNSFGPRNWLHAARTLSGNHWMQNVSTWSTCTDSACR